MCTQPLGVGLSWKTVVWAFRSTQESNWHPVTWLSHALDWQVFGLNPAGHHYVNLLLHVCNVVLLFVFLKRATRFVWRSFTVAALFAVHPINVESVAWVAERKNVLCTLFFFLALLAYLGYTRKPSIGRYLLLAGLFALGLMAKPMVITLPFVLLLLDYWPLERMRYRTAEKSFGANQTSLNPKVPKRSFRWLFLEKIPFLMLAVGSAIITLVAQRSGGAVSSIEEVSLGARVANAIVSYLHYIEKAVFPIHMAPLYPYPTRGVSVGSFVEAIIVLLGITGIVVLATQKHYLKTGWLWFLGTLVPVIGIVQIGNQSMADRYAYIPFVGLFIIVVWGVADWANQRRLRTVYMAVAAVFLISAMSVATEIQLSYWHDSVALWSHAIAVTTNNFVAEDNLGNALALDGKDEEALPHFRAALRIKPDDPVAELNLGVYELKHHDLQQSVGWYHRVLIDTTNSNLRMQAYANLGSCFRMLNDYEQAQMNYQFALQLDPNATLAIVGLGLVAQKTGDLDRAIENYARAVSIQPTDVGYLLLSQAWQKNGRPDEAQVALYAAKKLSRNIEVARQAAEALIAQ